ncbi:hypothetical protein F4818DRAFT_398764 [Hypoxylon cercidicola]|nr:hypothetical protein F4818DRAFT_398764 [Hypoxylon cercidicola]
MLWQQLWSGLTNDSNGHSNASFLKRHIKQVKSNLSHLASVNSPRHTGPSERDAAGHGPGIIEYDEADLLPKDFLVDALVEIYFAKIHPWILPRCMFVHLGSVWPTLGDGLG